MLQIVLIAVGVCLLASHSMPFSPKVCQKTKGLRMARLPDTTVCNLNVTKAYKVDVDIKVEDYTERATQGYLLYKIKSVCDVYENLLTATRVNLWDDPQPIHEQEIYMIRHGLCPYKGESTPYYRPRKAECVSNYLTETRTILEYCLVTLVTIVRTHKGTVRSDKAELESCMYASEYCRSKDGGVAYWVADSSIKTERVVWSGTADYSEGVLVVPGIQEAYTLLGPISVGSHQTQEGVTVVVKSTSPRTKRTVSDTVAAAVASVQGEVTGKLQYLSSTTLAPMKEAIDNICQGMGVQGGMLTSLLRSAPDHFIRWVLDDPYLTATIMDDVVLYWPCQPVTKWYVTPNLTTCYADLPVTFHNGEEWMVGYMNTQSGDITMQSTEMNCTLSVHWYKQGDKYYSVKGAQVNEVNVEALHRLPMHANKTVLSDLLVPKWDNTWVYNASMFIQIDRITAASGAIHERYDRVMSYLGHRTPDSQMSYIADQLGVGAWGLAPYGMLFSLYRVACQVGGALFFFQVFLLPTCRRVFNLTQGDAVPHDTIETEEEQGEEMSDLSPRRRYEQRKRNRGWVKTMTGRL